MNTTLTTLELNSNVIDYEGAKALAEALTENQSLTTLTLRSETENSACVRNFCMGQKLLYV